MGVINNIIQWFSALFRARAKDEFNIKPITSGDMDVFIQKCSAIYHGKPYWINSDEGVKTVNFAKFICSETAKLTTLGLTLTIDGNNERVKVLQKQIDNAKANMRQWVEYASAYGTVIIKPNGTSIEVVLPNKYMITEQVNGKVTGAVFINSIKEQDNYYTRFEYHRFIDGLYVITNKCYKSDTDKDIGKAIDIKQTPWSLLSDEIAIENLDTPLFGVLKMPSANNIDIDSPLAMPIFVDALEELRDLDVAYSRNAEEIDDSRRTVLLDSDRLIPIKGNLSTQVGTWENARKQMRLPKFVSNILGNGADDCYHEINPTLNTESRIKGINSLLSQIGFKCGFSNGYFVFNESSGFSTATQVTADQARTIQLIEDIRKMFDACMIDVIKAINTFEDLYGTTGHLEIADTTSTDEIERVIHLHFSPIYTNAEEDRQRALQLTNSGYYPKWYYLHKYEGLSEDEAKALTEEAQPKEEGLFTME